MRYATGIKAVHRPCMRRRGSAAGIVAYLEALKRNAILNNEPHRALWLEVITVAITDAVRPPITGRYYRADRQYALRWLSSDECRHDREAVFDLAGLDPGLAKRFVRIIKGGEL